MSDEQGKKKEGEPQADPKPGKEQEPSADSKNADGNQEPGPVPYERFKEVNDKAKSYEKRLAELEEKNEERNKEADEDRKKELKTQEKFQELAVELEGKVSEMEPELKEAQGNLKAANELLQQYADAQMESVPELFQSVVSGMPLTQRLAWLTENADKLDSSGPAGIPATPQGKGKGDELTSEQRRRQASRTF